MANECANNCYPPDCHQLHLDHRRVNQPLTPVHYSVSNRVVTRQDSCSSDVSLYPGDLPWTAFKYSAGQPQSSSRLCECDLLISAAVHPDHNGQTPFRELTENVQLQRNENIMLKRCQNDNTKLKPETVFDYGILPINPNINAKQEVFFDSFGKDNTFPAQDSKVDNEFQPSPMTPERFGNPSFSTGLTDEYKTVFEPRLQEFPQSSYKHSERADTFAGGRSAARRHVHQRRDNWNLKTWTSYGISILLLFGLAVSYVRLQARVDHLEDKVQGLSQMIQKYVQARSDAPKDDRMTPTADSNLYKASTSYPIGYTDSLLIYREDPTRNVRPHTPQSGHRESQKLHNAQRKIPAADKNGMDTSVLSGDKLPSSTSTRESVPASGSKEPDRKGIVDDEEESWREALKLNTIAADSDRVSGSISIPSLPLSRSKRDSVKYTEKELKRFCERKVCKKSKDQVLMLPSEQFIGDFYHIYDYNRDFLNKSRDCFHDKSLPTEPYVCKEATIRYPQQDSVLAVYRPVKGHAGTKKASTKKNKSCGGPLLEIADDTSGDFTVRIPGIYSIHVNITMVSDEGGNHSLALFLNDHAVLACPNGGFRCPRTNEPGSFKYRICNMHGMLELSEKDVIQIRTLHKDTVVRLENHRQSQFKAVLLHQSPEVNIKDAARTRGRC